MTRKDSDKDADRPHYYSQFWLDIAAGRRVIGGPKPEEAEARAGEAPEPAPSRKAGRGGADGYRETPANVVAQPVANEVEEEEFAQEETVEQPDIDLSEEFASEEEPLDDEVMEELEADDGMLDDEVVEEELEPEEEDFFDEEEEEEEWGRHGRKKPKPGRQAKPPAKKSRRDTRRSF
jgi:hypothetical protein